MPSWIACASSGPAIPAGERQRHVDPRRHSRGGGELAVEHYALGDGSAPSSRSSSSASQWLVARLPSSSPAAARISEPVQTEVVHVEVSCAPRSHSCTRTVPRQRHLAGTARDEHDLRMRRCSASERSASSRSGRCRCVIGSGLARPRT